MPRSPFRAFQGWPSGLVKRLKSIKVPSQKKEAPNEVLRAPTLSVMCSGSWDLRHNQRMRCSVSTDPGLNRLTPSP